jgi:hypothetical protein
VINRDSSNDSKEETVGSAEEMTLVEEIKVALGGRTGRGA